VEANPEAVAERLEREGVGAALVRLWQTHQVLMCFIPDVSLEDAQVLTGAGVYHLDDLLESDETDLENRLQAYLRSARGQRFRERGYRLGSRLVAWRRGAREQIGRWQQSARAARWRHFQELQRNKSLKEAVQVPTKHPKEKKLAARKGAANQAVGLQLERSSPIERVPSIGPKTAARLAKVGIHTVDDLLFAEAAEVAQRLDTKDITADTVACWQQQSHLACNMPGLRARDVQILVGCGLTDIESIARLKPAELLSLVEDFCSSSDGEQVLRGGTAPEPAECAEWIAWARQRRSLEAA
jgi:predicted flap endonuclease-1-like 5' DNA nuclease